MDLPALVAIYCPGMELKNRAGRLLSVSPHGYYEVILDFADGSHTALLPIQGTAIIFPEPIPAAGTIPDLER
jgi:hypothetical protein